MRAEAVGVDAFRYDTDPRFRVFVFGVPEVAVTDILDATVEEALESARALSNGDQALWALANVVDHALTVARSAVRARTIAEVRPEYMF